MKPPWHTFCHTMVMKAKHHITMDTTVVEVVARMAANDGRSFSNMVSRLVVEAISARDGSNALEQATMHASDRKGGYQ